MKRKNILIIEDNPQEVKSLAQILTREKYRIRPATSGLVGLKAAEAEPPDLILLDIKLPDISGFEICERLKKKRKTRGIPVVFISALDEVENKVKAFSQGGVDYITKPFYAQEVLSRIKTQISLRNMQKRLEHKNKQLRKEVNIRKQVEKSLKTAYDEMEKRVEERTEELRKKSDALKEANAALNVLLVRIEKDKNAFKENVLSHVKELVLPYIERLKQGSLKESQATLVEIIETNLYSITSPFIGKLTSRYLSLTPMEVRVAGFVKEGKSNKDIAKALNLSVGTILTHRHNIRRKLGLKNSKANLRTYLFSLE